jgi:uncharacterized protein (UPF0332 family)/predicted nucleotidyltransferase
MKFDIRNKNINHHHSKYHKNEIDIARDFTKIIYKEFGTFLKSVVLFGSAAKSSNPHPANSPTHKNKKVDDIDILVIVNDLTMSLTPEASETYKIIMEKSIMKVSDKVHLTTLTFTKFWDLIRNGDPVAINILRDGFALIDTGVFEPLQALLYQGKIRPTWESIWSYYSRAPITLENSRWHIRQAVIDLYWAVIDSAHAALMRIGEIPPSPSHVADLMDKSMRKKGLIEKRYVTIMRNFADLSKKIIRHDIKDISGSEYERHYKDAKDFVEVMKRIIDRGLEDVK